MLEFENILYLIGASFTFYVLYTLYIALVGPLASLPGPQSSKWTRLPLKIAILSGRRTYYIDALHVRYGPVVRLGPDEVSVSDIAAVKEIYKVTSKFQKSTWYNKLVGAGRNNLFSMSDMRQHAHRRRLLGGALSETSLKHVEYLIKPKIRLAVDSIKSENLSQGYADVFKWWTFMTTDVIGDLTFGDSFHMLESGRKNQYARDLQSVGISGGLRIELPLLTRLLAFVPLFQNARASNLRIDTYARQSLQRYANLLSEDASYSKPTLFSKLFRGEEAGALEPEDITFEAKAYIVAGGDTTATTLTYLIWILARNPDVQNNLRSEIHDVPDDFRYHDLRDLSYLGNVITETLRLYGSASNTLPRIVPAGGFSVQGHVIPAGIEIGTQAWTTHRNEEAFPDAHTFMPSRWEKPTQLMKDAYMPFGGGSRICIGLHLAMMELRLALVQFLRGFPDGFEVADGAGKSTKLLGMSDADMVAKTFFLSTPRGERCLIRSL